MSSVVLTESPTLDLLELGWQSICPLSQIIPDSGVAARVAGHPVAIFHLSDGRVLAVDHVDPTTGAAVIGRGIVGDHGGIPTVASPIHKQRFSLLDGHCLDDDGVSLATYATRIADGQVLIATP